MFQEGFGPLSSLEIVEKGSECCMTSTKVLQMLKMVWPTQAVWCGPSN